MTGAEKRAGWFVALGLLAVVLLTYARPLLGGDTFVSRDHLTHTVPAKVHLSDSLARGQLPEWWDGVGLGVPFAANPNHSTLYPPAWAVALLPMPWGADALLLAHLLLAGLGMAAFSRRLGADPQGAVVAGGALMTAGLVSSTVVHGGPLLTLAWIPWIAWAADRLSAAAAGLERVRAALAVAVLWGLQLLAGDPSFVLIGALLALGVVLCRARPRLPALAALGAAAAGAAVLAAVMLVPALYLLADSARAGGVDADAGQVWSMHPLRLAEWVWPRLLGDPNLAELNGARALADASDGRSGLGSSWALGAYVGVPVLVLAALGARGGRRVWLLAVAAAFVVLALGRYTPIYELFRTVFLPERLVRYPEKHAVGALVVLCALAGVGFSAALRGLSRRAAIGALGACAAFGVGVVAVLVGRERLAAAMGEARLRPAVDGEAVMGLAGEGAVAALLAIGLVVGALALARGRTRSWAGPLAAAALVGHMVGQVWPLLPLADRDEVTRVPALLEPVAAEADGPVRPRLYRPQTLPVQMPPRSAAEQAVRRHDTAIPNSATRYGFAYVVGYDQAQSERLRKIWTAAAAAGGRMLDLFDVAYAVLPATVAAPAGMPVVADTGRGDVVLARNEHRRPRAFVAARWSWHADDDEIAAALFPAGVGGGEGVRYGAIRLSGAGEPAPDTGDGPVPAPPCQVRSPRPERVELRCRSESGGYAVLLDAWAPGWSATVDGEPAVIERADLVARAVRIGPGEHEVVFRYRTPGLRLGAWISLLGWLNALLGAIIIRRLGDRRRSPTASA